MSDGTHGRKKRPGRPGALYTMLGGATRLAAAISAFVLAAIVIDVAVKAIPNLKLSMFSFTYTSKNSSFIPSLIITLEMTAAALIISAPLGLGAAVYTVEYASKGNRLISAVRIAAETLSGIPSIVFGLFGMIFFVEALGWGFSFIAGAFTLAIMILPSIMRTAEEALLSVPANYREGSFALGAGRLRTVMKVTLPAAAPGILSGIILAIGRIVGETAALVYTAGTVAKIPGSLTDSVRTLSVHMYLLSSEGLHVNEAYATALLLLVFVIAINALASFFAGKISKG